MPTDPKHGQNIPAGQQIARTLAAFNRQIGNTIRAAIAARRSVSFHAFITPMVESLLPLARLHFARGRLNTYRRLRRLLAQRAAAKLEERKRKGMILATLTLKNAPPFVTASPPGSPGGIEIAFDVFLPQVELTLQRMVFQFVESTLATAAVDAQRAYQQFREELRQGLSEGESLQSLNARVGAIFDDPVRAHRVAMTEASRAMHAGQEQAARESGIVKGLRWLASTDACEHCLAIDGKEVPLGQPFYVDPKGGPYATVTHPPLHPHCLLGGTRVKAPGGFISGYSAKYRGPALRVILANGDEFACTPHHRFLTNSGLTFASSLVKGDNLLNCEWKNLTAGAPDDHREPTLIDEVVRTLAVSGGMASRSVPPSPEYLHGDAAFCQGNIDVVTSKSLLKDTIGTRSRQPVDHFGFVGTAGRGVGFDGQSSLESLFIALGLAAPGGLRWGNERLTFIIRQAKPLGFHALAMRSNLNASGNEPLAYGQSGSAETLGYLLNSFPGTISPNKIVNIEEFTHDGPVYDIETSSGLYIINNGVISGNCMCAVEEVIE